MLTRHDTERLTRLLKRAELAVGEHAVEQAWRADAMHAVKEKLVERYHRNRYDDAHDLIADLKATRAKLETALESGNTRQAATR